MRSHPAAHPHEPPTSKYPPSSPGINMRNGGEGKEWCWRVCFKMRTTETTTSLKKEARNILLLQTTIVILHVMTELVSKRNNSTNPHLSLSDSICPWRLRRPEGIFLFLSDDVFLFLPPSVVSPSRFFLFPIFFALFPLSSFRGECNCKVKIYIYIIVFL